MYSVKREELVILSGTFIDLSKQFSWPFLTLFNIENTPELNKYGSAFSKFKISEWVRPERKYLV